MTSHMALRTRRPQAAVRGLRLGIRGEKSDPTLLVAIRFAIPLELYAMVPPSVLGVVPDRPSNAPFSFSRFRDIFDV
jgi:hypothetical protein